MSGKNGSDTVCLCVPFVLFVYSLCYHVNMFAQRVRPRLTLHVTVTLTTGVVLTRDYSSVCTRLFACTCAPLYWFFFFLFSTTGGA